MRKILFFISFFLLLSPLVASAVDQYYCKCAKEDLNGRKCLGGFTNTTTAEAACPKCTQHSGDVTKDPDCAGEVSANPAAPTTGGSADSGATVKLNNPLVGDLDEQGKPSINIIIGNIIKTATGVMGALVLLMIVWGGVTWLTAAGNPEKIKSGSNTIIWAILGAVVVLGSYIILTAVLAGLAG